MRSDTPPPPDRAVTALAQEPASPAPPLPRPGLDPASAQKSAPWLRASGDRRPLLPAPAAARRRPAKGRSPACAAPGATVSRSARGLAARDRYAGQSQRQATGNAPRWRIKKRDPPARRARGRAIPVAKRARCARLHAGRSGVNAPLRYAFNITAHYPKSGQSLRRLRFVARPLRALRVRVMVCYVLRPCAAKCVSRRCAVVYSALRARWHTPNRGAALPRLRRARWPASPVVSWQTAVPPAPTF